jgi:hypothetical protein
VDRSAGTGNAEEDNGWKDALRVGITKNKKITTAIWLYLPQFGAIFGPAPLMFSCGEKHPGIENYEFRACFETKGDWHNNRAGWLREAVAPICSSAGLICLVLRVAPPTPIWFCCNCVQLLGFCCNSGAILVQFSCNFGAIAVQLQLPSWR